MFISFIVPVYNTEQYLRECLDSMIAQDIPAEEYEILCVNDGSTDNSLAILQEYADKYSHVHFYNEKNSGVASARNVGLDAAKGDYIWFVDSDDLVKNNCLGMIKSHCKTNTVDRIKIGTYVFGDGELTIEDVMNEGITEANSHFYDSSVWNSILLRRFLQSNNCYFRYPELTHGEDSIFMFEVLSQKPICSEIDVPCYFYRNRPGSAINDSSPDAKMRQLRSHFLAVKIMKHHYDNGVGSPRDASNLLMSYVLCLVHHEWVCLFAWERKPRYS